MSLTALLVAKLLYDLPRRYALRALVSLVPGVVAVLAATPAAEADAALGTAYLLAAIGLLGLATVTVVDGYRENGVGAARSA